MFVKNLLNRNYEFVCWLVKSSIAFCRLLIERFTRLICVVISKAVLMRIKILIILTLYLSVKSIFIVSSYVICWCFNSWNSKKRWSAMLFAIRVHELTISTTRWRAPTANQWISLFMFILYIFWVWKTWKDFIVCINAFFF